MEKVSFESNAPILQKEYSIPPHMYDSAYKDYQRKFIYPINYIITAVLVILAIAGIVLLITGKPVFIVLSILCIIADVLVWVFTSNNRKKVVQNLIQVKDERQTAKFFDEGIIITNIPKGRVEGEKHVVEFSKDDVKILDKRYYFIVMVKPVFYIIPKKVFDASEETSIAKSFEKKLGKNYIK